MTAVNEAAQLAQLDRGTWLTEESARPRRRWARRSMGSMTFSGKSTDFDAVAAWLQSLRRQAGYADPYRPERDRGRCRGHQGQLSTTSSPVPSSALKRRRTATSRLRSVSDMTETRKWTAGAVAVALLILARAGSC